MGAMHALVTPRLRLEPLLAAHADALYPVLADARMAAYVDQPPPPSVDALRERYRRLESRSSPEGGEAWLNWAVRTEAGVIGVVQATVQADRRAWIAYEIGVAHWGRGFATEAVRAMVAQLIDHDRVTQCLATVDARNERSWRLLERLQFVRVDATQPSDWLYQRAGADAGAAGATPCR
jgi:ribosomal-protein-alanine N-acetyltransferase